MSNEPQPIDPWSGVGGQWSLVAFRLACWDNRPFSCSGWTAVGPAWSPLRRGERSGRQCHGATPQRAAECLPGGDSLSFRGRIAPDGTGLYRRAERLCGPAISGNKRHRRAESACCSLAAGSSRPPDPRANYLRMAGPHRKPCCLQHTDHPAGPRLSDAPGPWAKFCLLATSGDICHKCHFSSHLCLHLARGPLATAWAGPCAAFGSFLRWICTLCEVACCLDCVALRPRMCRLVDVAQDHFNTRPTAYPSSAPRGYPGLSRPARPFVSV